MDVQVAAVIAAAGSSVRMGGIKKEFRPLPVSNTSNNEKPLTVLGSALRSFASISRITTIVIAIPAGQEEAAALALPPELRPDAKRIFFVTGGASRQASVFNALSMLENRNPSLVLIHDGARPWITAELIEKTIDAAIVHKAVIPILPVTETPKEGDFSGPGGTGFITRHLQRSQVGLAQTPQAFAFQQILEAHRKAAQSEGIEF
ncbi:MAG: 2-C-methyl-D-erythritol 4-phosphate cytidylyltransferase, partial [Treponema sp.]|nr:2-C-methyl-D-erythritol 4-phosphate cytidylyltransferase [Treponema sp.]